ncbi:hypothetical protein IT087_01320 [Candidatus Uhrbacteria bacterium]|nr:hypothetical protein [Candidatus Uhrbacteria bacterium]
MSRSATGPLKAVAAGYEVKTELAPGGYLLSALAGTADADFAASVRGQVMPKLKPPEVVDWIADATLVTKFAPTLVKPASEVMRDFKAREGRHVIWVIPEGSIIRMAAMSVNLASNLLGGTKIVVVATMQDAVRTLNELRLGGGT